MEPIIHLLLPLIILLVFLPKYKKEVIILSFFAWIMDFDYFIPDLHRILFHNLSFVIIMALVMYFIFGGLYSLISIYYMLSHLILDLEILGVPFFYPFYKYLIGLDIALIKPLVGPFSLKFDLVLTPIEKITRYSPSGWLETQGIIFLLLLSSAIIVYYLIKNRLFNKK